jgi:hypothetical protein
MNDLYFVEYTENGIFKRCFEASYDEIMGEGRARSLCSEMNYHYPNCDYRVVKLVPEYKLDELQAQIDKLMLEYCPNEMTESKRHNWALHQKPVMEKL